MTERATVNQAPPVCRYLDCSTGYLSAPEGAGLYGEINVPVTVHSYAEGAFVWVPPDADEFAERDWTAWPNLRAVLEYARGLDCDWVNFDADGADLPDSADLPRFEW